MGDSHQSEDRTALLNLVSQVKARVADKVEAKVEFPMPQFILIGKQSVGKSRLVESFAGEQFNFVSGTLGSRRPTVLEFRNNPNLQNASWQILDLRTHQWRSLPVSEVMVVVGEAHESLGTSVTRQPVYVKVESPFCVDMQIVDLPGFRDFALDKSKQDLADQIESLVGEFMADTRNVLLCVEEAGDAANMSSLARCKRVDPDYRRTILIRNKLDKYYKDLTPDNVNDWLKGYGDLPEHLEKYSLTLPHWKEGTAAPKPFIELRADASDDDTNELRSKGATDQLLSRVGFQAFTNFMELKIQTVFFNSLGPSLVKLKELRSVYESQLTIAARELADTQPDNILHSIRTAGQSFSHALNYVLSGQVQSQVNRMTLEDELLSFENFIAIHGDDSFDILPTPDFQDLPDYINYLREEARIPAFDIPLNGGAQYTRLKHECEVYFRFSEICVEVSKRDVLQARGISIGQVSWQDVVLKLLANEGQPQVKRKVNYVARRIEWFFTQQKDNIIEFMDTIKGSADEHLYSQLFTQRVQLIKENEMARTLLFNRYDKFLTNQRALFTELFFNTLQSTFQYPWALIKASSWSMEELDNHVKPGEEEDEGEAPASPTSSVDPFADFATLPSFEDTVARIPLEMSHRATIEGLLQSLVNEIPIDSDHVEIAVEKVQALMITVFRAIRNLICDQMELFADSFFLLPMSRHLEGQMIDVVLSEQDVARFAGLRDAKEEQAQKISTMLENINWSAEAIEQFARRRGGMYR
jgi:GTP-binding protein EngB required for normal cell division